MLFGKKKTEQQSPQTKMEKFYNLLTGADDTYKNLPMNMRLDINRISQGLAEFGPRKLRRRGLGTEFYEARDFRPDADERRHINARLSARAGRPIVVEKEAEIRQHFYLWRDPSGSMEYKSDDNLYSKREAAEVMLLAFAKHLAKNEELIGVYDTKGTYRGGKASNKVAEKLQEVSILTGDLPVPAKKLPRNSTAVFFSDFLMPTEELTKGLAQINGIGLQGIMVMVLDPQEINFDFSGHVEFEGMEDEGTEIFKKAETMREEYHHRMREHINEVKRICKAKGFKCIIQRTDQPLHDALLEIYGFAARTVENCPVLTPR